MILLQSGPDVLYSSRLSAQEHLPAPMTAMDFSLILDHVFEYLQSSKSTVLGVYVIVYGLIVLGSLRRSRIGRRESLDAARIHAKLIEDLLAFSSLPKGTTRKGHS